MYSVNNQARNNKHADLLGDETQQHVPIAEVDMRYNFYKPLTYSSNESRFVSLIEKNRRIPSILSLSAFLEHAFIPKSVAPNYYNYVRWRFMQRYINAVVHVLGTQSLIIGLGLKSTRVGFASASTTWICKDALGKIARMFWASKMGQRFDYDAKRWRFRSSLVFAVGNGLEICAQAFPSLFLLCATLSNTGKQMSMLTSSATRSAIYNSFSINEDDIKKKKVSEKKNRKEPAGRQSAGGGRNIGDITAKGEAQIAFVDLLGIASGICLSKIIGVSVRSVLSAWALLQVGEILCMYKEISAVVFRVLNFERMWAIMEKFVHIILLDKNNELITSGYDERKKSFYNEKEKSMRDCIPTPMEMSSQERIFLSPKPLACRSNCFGSFGRAKLDPSELDSVMNIFRGEKFLLVVGKNLKKQSRPRVSKIGKDRSDLEARQNCHIILHKDATNVDIVKSTLALGVLRTCLAASKKSTFAPRTSECLQMLRFSKTTADQWFPSFLRVLQSRGWATPARFMFGTVTMRADWPIVPLKNDAERKMVVEKTMPPSEPVNHPIATAT